VKLGVSACLLGQPVRYDGGHKRHAFLVDLLGRHVTWVPVCPEVEAGMGVPRPALRLIEGGSGGTRLVVAATGEDQTGRMEAWARGRLDLLAADGLHGYVLKERSPSCGAEGVEVRGADGEVSRHGAGVFAEALRARFPLLAVEEEGRLADPEVREGFLARVFTVARFRRMLSEDGTPAGLVAFHAAHKLLLHAHDTARYRTLGPLVAGRDGRPFPERLLAYGEGLLRTLATPPSRGRHVDVMEHLSGFVKDALSADDKAELARLLEEYRDGVVPLEVPRTRLRDLLRRHDADAWALGQVYLEPYPADLVPRTAV
jgi:uncharacterized protein YbbK (DUF523 family)/uncharacterized protein YbgA (DUF1722 family)